ncbi:uncharacterized protein LOC131072520 [Cryptomeria japonica]|uniref:uncharacterized protein LOC131072520 n=1 Tax=Cryptomeria japonica TaxID=3369 RepID=UPI0027DA2899|nr:uncharacterized protein LOC131072520 [Cryptomeria japonica]
MQMVRLVDAHCHLADKRLAVADVGSLIGAAANAGVCAFAVNGTSEEDWELVKEMSETHSSVIPNFGLHPWFAGKCTSNWLPILKGFFEAVPSAAVGEIGLDKGCPQGKAVDFALQKEVFRQQLELGMQLQRPISVHCVSAFGELHAIIEEMGTFPAGIILHSYMGSAEMVQRLAKFGAYFSFSGFITFKKLQEARKIVRAVPTDRILLETDAPDALPHLNLGSLVWVPGDPLVPLEFQEKLQYQLRSDTVSNEYATPVQDNRLKGFDSSVQKKALNHPANIYTVLKYVANLLEISDEKLAQISYENAVRVFSYSGSKLC